MTAPLLPGAMHGSIVPPSTPPLDGAGYSRVTPPPEVPCAPPGDGGLVSHLRAEVVWRDDAETLRRLFRRNFARKS